jgi:hypothetical protein
MWSLAGLTLTVQLVFPGYSGTFHDEHKQHKPSTPFNKLNKLAHSATFAVTVVFSKCVFANVNETLHLTNIY